MGELDHSGLALAIDLVNSGVGASDELASVAALRLFLVAHGEPPPRRLGRDDVAAVHALRDELTASFTAAGDARAAHLNRLLESVNASPQLVAHDSVPWHLHFTRPDARWAAWMRAKTAMALAMFVSDYGIDRMRTCRAAPCCRVFVDRTRNGSRRACSARCAGRANVAAHRARRRAPARDGESMTAPSAKNRRMADAAPTFT